VTQTVGSSGSIPAPRRRADKTISIRQLLTGKRKPALTTSRAVRGTIDAAGLRRPWPGSASQTSGGSDRAGGGCLTWLRPDARLLTKPFAPPQPG
jgi:hypothetical protein